MREEQRRIDGRAKLLLGVLTASLIAALLGPSPTLARQVTQYGLSSSFDGRGPGAAGLGGVGVNHSTGNIITLSGEARLNQFDSSGNQVAFPSSGSYSISSEVGEEEGMTVDNSGTATQGRMYTAGIAGGIHAFEPDGSPVINGNFPPEREACGVGVDPRTGDFWAGGGFSPLALFTPDGLPTGLEIPSAFSPFYVCRVAVDSNGNVYAGGYFSEVSKFNSSGEFQYVLDHGGDTGVAVDPSTDNVFIDNGSSVIEYDSSGIRLTTFGGFAGSEGVAVNQTNHDVYVATASGTVEIFAPGTAITLPGATTGLGSDFQPTSVKLDGEVAPEGVPTTDCQFEWGETLAYGNLVPCSEGNIFSGSGEEAVSAEIGGLTQGTTYHYRLVASNVNGTLTGLDRPFTPSAPPSVSESVTNVHADSVMLRAQINPGGATTTYRFEYGTADCSLSSCASTPDGNAGSGLANVNQATVVTGLTAGTTYHYRVVATNQSETAYGPDRTFTTFPLTTLLHDPCPNAHVRQQTGSALLLDCRAYELVSAADTNGYDVVSDLVSGQAPFASFPQASKPPRVLYAVKDGGIPGTGEPTNRGRDPYVATRGVEGWTTSYIGVPANNRFSTAPFSSSPSGVDAALGTFAFGGPEGCSPCFEGGYTGVPLRLPDGGLVQGMSGPENPGPSAKPDGYIAKDLSANGEHFIFGSTSRFAPGGNSGGDISIYDHNLRTGDTKVISNTPGGEDFPEALPCLQGIGKCNAANNDSNGISELDISSDGSRILLGQKIATDANDNVYWHLYMEIGDSLRSIDLTPGTTSGVLYGGMTESGSTVFFATTEKLGADSDESADVYAVEVGSSAANVTQISTGVGGAGDTNSCNPVSNSNGEHWNVIGSTKNCDAVAIGGGGGVAAGDGSIFFLSPEMLDGVSSGVADQPNLYLASPGSAPRFIATLNPNDAVVLDSVKETETRRTADFQVTPDASVAAFPTTAPLSDYENQGHTEIYRYDATSKALQCVSCAPTNAAAEGDASLASEGLSLSDDGRVFFDSTDALSARDLDTRRDAYEWEPLAAEHGNGVCEETSLSFSPVSDGCLGLISTGSSPFDSSLLGVSADGVDAYFFTRDVLVPQDHNGDLVKIYDARSAGGFPYAPPPPPCKASDECHGAGSPTPPVAPINTVTGNGGNVSLKMCRKKSAKKHGRCVRKHRHHSPRRRKR